MLLQKIKILINKWTNKEIDYLKNNYLELTDEQIGVDINKSPSAVKSKRQRLGLEKDKSHKKYTFKDVINEFSKTDYILISDESDYINSAENTLKYFCPRHMDKGLLSISLWHLMNGQGCWYCGQENTHKKKIIPDNILDCECREICENKNFIYKGFVRENNGIYIQYVCKEHQETGIQKMKKGNMSRENIHGCPFCIDTKKYKSSKGENKIANVLDNIGIKYVRQYYFDECKDVRTLPFDFYLTNLNKIIEYDGQHHFYPVRFNGISQEEARTNYSNTIKHDYIKNLYCKNNDIQILRIPFYEYKNIENIVSQFILDEKEDNL